MKRFKKLTAGLMGVVMALGVCSFTAFAGEGKEVEIKDDTSLANAIVGQADGQTWVFEDKTYDLKSTIKITKDITIEGNGAVLSYINKIYSESDAKERCGFHIDSGAKVEINDLTIEGNGKIKHGVNVYTSTGDEITTVKLNGVIMNDGTGYGLVNNSSNVTVTDIETSGNGWGGINVDNPPDAGKDGAEFEMISGTIGEKTSVKIENRANNTITAKINGGTFEGDVFIDDDVKKATLTITNGTFANDVTK